MQTHSDFPEERHEMAGQIIPPTPQTTTDVTPPVGETPPQILAQQAAEGHRGAAWRLMLWILQNDPRAMVAVSSLEDDRLAAHLLEFIAMGTWAGKPFVVPLPLRSPFARTRLRTLFMPGAGMGTVRIMHVLVPAIHDPRPAMRANAIHILGLMGRPSEASLVVPALKDPDASVRMQAVKALGRLGNPDVVPDLINALRTADEEMGSQVFLSLVQLGSAAVPFLLDASHSPVAWIRWHCYRALGGILDDRAIPVLVRGLADLDHGVAWMAARQLVQFGKSCLGPTLHFLIVQELTPWLAETASYVLHMFYNRAREYEPYLKPVVQSMHEVAAQIGTPVAARKALDRLEADGIIPKRVYA
jgi:hypothetical protein